MAKQTSDRNLNRRTVLKTLGVSAVGLGGLAGSATAQGQNGSALTRIGVNTFDNDNDGVDISVERSRLGGRPAVAHVTSDGPTADYVTLVVNVGNVRLGDVDTLTYDYYATSKNSETPDEVFFLIKDTDGETHTVWHHKNGGASGSWQTRNVHNEITNSGSFQWRELNVGYIGQNLIDAFSADASIRRVGAGRGTTAGGDTIDIAFDNLKINGAGRGQFPKQ